MQPDVEKDTSRQGDGALLQRKCQSRARDPGLTREALEGEPRPRKTCNCCPDPDFKAQTPSDCLCQLHTMADNRCMLKDMGRAWQRLIQRWLEQVSVNITPRQVSNLLTSPYAFHAQRQHGPSSAKIGWRSASPLKKRSLLKVIDFYFCSKFLFSCNIMSNYFSKSTSLSINLLAQQHWPHT